MFSSTYSWLIIKPLSVYFLRYIYELNAKALGCAEQDHTMAMSEMSDLSLFCRTLKQLRQPKNAYIKDRYSINPEAAVDLKIG